jgi:hypothetical protein
MIQSLDARQDKIQGREGNSTLIQKG